MGLFDALAGVAGSAISSAVSYKIAKAQIDFQREQSATVHQRGVADLRAAGLNPILSARYGGNPAAPGAKSEFRIDGAGAIASAAQASLARQKKKQSEAEVDYLDERGALAHGQTLLAGAQKMESHDRGRNLDAQTDLLKAQLPGAMIEAKLDTPGGVGEVTRTLNRIFGPANTAKGLLLKR